MAHAYGTRPGDLTDARIATFVPSTRIPTLSAITEVDVAWIAETYDLATLNRAYAAEEPHVLAWI
jgi:hypothetical protein